MPAAGDPNTSGLFRRWPQLRGRWEEPGKEKRVAGQLCAELDGALLAERAALGSPCPQKGEGPGLICPWLGIISPTVRESPRAGSCLLPGHSMVAWCAWPRRRPLQLWVCVHGRDSLWSKSAMNTFWGGCGCYGCISQTTSQGARPP